MTSRPPNDEEDTFVADFKAQNERLSLQPHAPPYVRSILARWMFALIAFMSSLLILGNIFDYLTIEESKDLAGIVVAPIVGIFATIVGFFFADSQRNKDSI